MLLSTAWLTLQGGLGSPNQGLSLAASSTQLAPDYTEVGPRKRTMIYSETPSLCLLVLFLG